MKFYDKIDGLMNEALKKEGVIASNGALCVTTGSRTGRSPKDRYLVDDSITHDTVDWGVINQPISKDDFNKLWQKAEAFALTHQLFESMMSIGADPAYQVHVHVRTQLAWHHLFCQNLFIQNADIKKDEPFWTLLCLPDLNPQGNVSGTAAVVLDFENKRILVSGTHYAGEMKKAMFSVMNFMMTDVDVLPMHCSANVGKNGDVALFFGLSGTGKTTLSADPERFLIGDDEHGWSPNGIFNFEGGCYAKCINLARETEPMIWDALRPGTVMENVILKDGLVPDFADASLTENTRAAYPLTFIEGAVGERPHGHPKNVVMLTCDLYGVLPPVSRLSIPQALYYFLSGYTALVGSTETGEKGIKQTFSRCFGAPFFSRPSDVYAKLLQKRLEETGANVFLVNTGWTGGAYGAGGKRFEIPVTRRIIDAITSGEIMTKTFEKTTCFGLEVPTELEGVDSKLLNPILSWSSAQEYDEKCEELRSLFQENYNHKFSDCGLDLDEIV